MRKCEVDEDRHLHYSLPALNTRNVAFPCQRGSMINVSVMYPNRPGHNSICPTTAPLTYRSRTLVGTALLDVVVEEGIAGMGPDLRPPFIALGHLYFESVDSFQTAMGPHLAQIQADIPNYTTSSPPFRSVASSVQMTRNCLD